MSLSLSEAKLRPIRQPTPQRTLSRASSQSRFEATVVATYGRRASIRADDGAVSDVRLFGRRLAVVCGDRVECENEPGTGGIHLTACLARKTTLYRSNLRGAAEPVVANLDQIFVAVAPRPTPDWFVVDRYLSAAASAAISAALILNKTDLPVDAEIERELANFAACGYTLLRCSTRSGEGLPAVFQACADSRSVLVGQSGTGKSSLLSHLIPDANALTGELVRDDEGRHTTSVSRMYSIVTGGELIDSPGVRDFAPALDHLEPSTLGFLDVAQLAPNCRFQDCKHMREPGCAVRSAAESGVGLSSRRYESYRRLRNLVGQLEDARGPKRRT